MATTEQQLVPFQKRMESVRALIERMKPQLALALPRGLGVDRFARVVLTDVLRNPRLADCDPRSFAGALLQAAQLGLETGVLGFAYLVPFRNNKANRLDCQLIPGYKGLIQLARRSGQISGLDPRVVHAKDKFKVRYGTARGIDHDPFSGDGDPGAFVAAYAVAHFKDGGYSFEVMWKRDIDAVRDRYSRAAGEGPWVTDYEAMALKTVLRRLSKFLPMSVEMHTAVILDEQAEAGIPQDLGTLIEADADAPPGSIAPPAASKLDQLAETLTAPPSGGDGAARTSESPEPPAPPGVSGASEAEGPGDKEAQETKRRPGRPRKAEEAATPPAEAAPPPTDPYSLSDFERDLTTATTQQAVSQLLIDHIYGAHGLSSRLTSDGKKRMNTLIVDKREALQGTTTTPTS